MGYPQRHERIVPRPSSIICLSQQDHFRSRFYLVGTLHAQETRANNRRSQSPLKEENTQVWCASSQHGKRSIYARQGSWEYALARLDQ